MNLQKSNQIMTYKTKASFPDRNKYDRIHSMEFEPHTSYEF